MADTPVDTSKVAKNTCIYWDATGGVCSAAEYFVHNSISCYDEENNTCKTQGLCLDCSKYSVGGLSYTQYDVLGLYRSGYKFEYNKLVKRYLPTEEISDNTPSSVASYSYAQTPMHLSIYNLRAQMQPCCYWAGPVFTYSKTNNDVLVASLPHSGVSASLKVDYLKEEETPHIYSGLNSKYVNARAVSMCTLDSAMPWRLPYTSENDTPYGCNGCKAECPYYTGPRWQYCVDEKMSAGDAISAAQILELRYYSDDWSSYENAQSEWNKRFKNPVIYGWTGQYVDGGVGGVELPLVQEVGINTFISDNAVIYKGPAVPISEGISTAVGASSELEYVGENYPSFITEIDETREYLNIRWPHNTSASHPYLFRVWDIDNAVIRIFFQTSHYSTVYAINITGLDLSSFDSDADKLKYLRSNHHKRVVSVSPSLSSPVHYVDVTLLPNPSINNIVFYVAVSDETGHITYKTASCFVDCKLYHAYAAQSFAETTRGHHSPYPIIDHLNGVRATVDFIPIINTPKIHKVLWDTYGGGGISTYPIEEVVNSTISSKNITAIGCDLLAISFDDTRCNPVDRWTILGKTADGTELGATLQTSIDGEDASAKLELVFQSYTGKYIPANVVLFSISKEDRKKGVYYDAREDSVSVVYTVTTYKQAPVVSSDYVKLKHPEHSAYYMRELPYNIRYDDDHLYVNGPGIMLYNSNLDTFAFIEDLEEVRSYIIDRLAEEENKAIESFANAGGADDYIITSSTIFSEASAKFSAAYNGFVFISDGVPVTLYEVCKRLQYIQQYEGDLKFTYVFEDETGRPVGIKRNYLLIQSALAETRDVEIKYQWDSKRLAWPIIDSMLLLAKYSEPMRPAQEFEGISTYYPKCGDHSEFNFTEHEAGTPGPLWYPYILCKTPKYHEDYLQAAVKCSNYVEGFVRGNSHVGSLEGKRWAYWERMRSHDKLDTWVSGPIFLVGCFYREVSYTYQYKDPVFSGYTRIRSSYPDAPFSKDREAFRISTHYIKRNLDVYSEVVMSTDDPVFNILFLSESYKDAVFVNPSDPSLGILTGKDSKTSVWVHQMAGVSEVELTSQNTEHPYTHHTLVSRGGVVVNETVETGDAFRDTLSSIFNFRDLNIITNRNTNGSLLYKDVEPDVLSVRQDYKEIIPTYSDRGVLWAWLERPKEIERAIYSSANRINGINFDNPTSFVYDTNFTPASSLTDGDYSIKYTPPVFNRSTGVVDEHASISFSNTVSVGVSTPGDGPALYIHWPTGRLFTKEDSIYAHFDTQSDFVYFGLGDGGKRFLFYNGERNRYIADRSNTGVTYKYTAAGISVCPDIQVTELPYLSVTDTVDAIVRTNPPSTVSTSVVTDYSKMKQFLGNGQNIQALFYLYGDLFIESVKFTYTVDYGGSEQERFCIPGINMLFTSEVSGEVQVLNTGQLVFYKPMPDDIDGYDIYSSPSLDTNASKTYNVNEWANKISLSFSFPAGFKIKIEDIDFTYRSPIVQEENITVHEREVHQSRGYTGDMPARELLYYYSRNSMLDGREIGLSLTQQAGVGGILTSTQLSSTKFESRIIKDVILEYEYGDVTGGRRFPYSVGVRPSEEIGGHVYADAYGVLAVKDAFVVNTKSDMLIAGNHKEDSPQWDTGQKNPLNTAVNEDSSCASVVGDKVLNEELQKCLYKEAVGLVSDTVTVYKWFWHEDELDFWEGTVGIELPTMPGLVLNSAVSSLDYIFRHEFFGCESNLAVPYYDGKVHTIPLWSALGHRLRVGNAKFNNTCMQVVIFKIQEHLGEKTYGSSDYGNLSEEIVWPYESYRDRDYYINAGLIEKDGYIGGGIGGVGPGFWAAQSELSHGFTPPQLDTQREVDESVNGGQTSSVRAED